MDAFDLQALQSMSSLHNNIEINVSEEARKKIESLSTNGQIPSTTSIAWNNQMQTSDDESKEPEFPV